ncbi:MAG: response regulator [Thermoplasmata archaeon]|nr:MAG: response regulator [Thermoplasmata archaeon]
MAKEGIEIVKIFIVDDKLFFHQMYKNFFEMEGYEVIGNAYNGSEAVSEYKKLEPKPDIVIMDHIMPYRNGLEAAKEILEYDSEAKIIFVSIDQNIKNLAMDAGVLRFISKPFQMQSLLDNIREIAEEQ